MFQSMKVKGNTSFISKKYQTLAIVLTSFLVGYLFHEADRHVQMVKETLCSALDEDNYCDPSIVYRGPKGFPPIPRKVEFGEFMDKYGFERGVEVGVQRGRFSRNLLERWKSCKYLALVDVWAEQANYKDLANANASTQELIYEEAMMSVAKWKEKVEVFRMYSSEAAKKIPDNSLDFAYIDARHDYCGVMEDLESYYGKVRPGGIVAGHDFHTAEEVKAMSTSQDWSLCGNGTVEQRAVRGAVEDFFAKKELVVSFTYKEKDWYSWWVQKPTNMKCIKN